VEILTAGGAERFQSTPVDNRWGYRLVRFWRRIPGIQSLFMLSMHLIGQTPLEFEEHSVTNKGYTATSVQELLSSNGRGKEMTGTLNLIKNNIYHHTAAYIALRISYKLSQTELRVSMYLPVSGKAEMLLVKPPMRLAMLFHSFRGPK
jgi:hypothetical protein